MKIFSIHYEEVMETGETGAGVAGVFATRIEAYKKMIEAAWEDVKKDFGYGEIKLQDDMPEDLDGMHIDLVEEEFKKRTKNLEFTDHRIQWHNHYGTVYTYKIEDHEVKGLVRTEDIKHILCETPSELYNDGQAMDLVFTYLDKINEKGYETGKTFLDSVLAD